MIKLTAQDENDGQYYDWWVNPAHIITMSKRARGGSIIVIYDYPEGMDVMESPEEILNMLDK